MPNPIDTSYLSEIQSDESERIQQLEKEILTVKEEKVKAKNVLDIAEQELRLGLATSEFLNRKISALKEKGKLYSLIKDESSSDKNIKSVKDAERTAAMHTNYVKYAQSRHDYLKSSLDLREAEISISIWEIQYEKSKIAREYQDKRPEEFPEKKSKVARYFQDKKKIEPKEYEKFMLKQREIANEAKKKNETMRKEMTVLEQYRNQKFEVE